MRAMMLTMYRLMPTGGVSSPIIRFSTTTIARWTGSTPAATSAGVMTGARIRIAARVSMNMPTTSSSTLTSSSSTHGCSDTPSRNPVAFIGTWSIVSTHANSAALPTISITLAADCTVSRAAATRPVHVRLR